MDIEEYDDLEDGLDKSDLVDIYDIFFREASVEPEDVTFSKLKVLCDKQWHTSELPDEKIQHKMREWIVSNWRETNDFLLLTLSVCYCFGLDKKLFCKALNLYDGEFKDEYIRHLENSVADNIDPYWSMRIKE